MAGKTYYAKYTEKVKSGITVVGVVSEDEEVNGSLPDAYEEDTITLTNTFDGIPEGKFVSSWEVVEPQGLAIENNSFKMPAQEVKLRAILADEPTEEEPGQTVSGADGGAAAAVILGGAAIGAVTYAVGTQIWMETHLRMVLFLPAVNSCPDAVECRRQAPARRSRFVCRHQR